ncbi:hypothetical protein ACVR0S_04205 [Streptococcus dentapri]|uniref:Uncharacterized protein n=1 Tax=Streptococcus dentapri TaxID=573564 RepID=A0ABV8D1K2_9STRE
MIDTRKLMALDEEYEDELRKIRKAKEKLEDNFHEFMMTTNILREQVYQVIYDQNLEIPPEAQMDLYDMDSNADYFQLDIHR